MTTTLEKIAQLEKQIAALKLTEQNKEAQRMEAMQDGRSDTELLTECMKSLEWATYHDGRYDQYKSEKWQDRAQQLVMTLEKRLNRKAYEGF